MKKEMKEIWVLDNKENFFVDYNVLTDKGYFLRTFNELNQLFNFLNNEKRLPEFSIINFDLLDEENEDGFFQKLNDVVNNQLADDFIKKGIIARSKFFCEDFEVALKEASFPNEYIFGNIKFDLINSTVDKLLERTRLSVSCVY